MNTCGINLYEHMLSVVFVFLSQNRKRDIKYVLCCNVNILTQIQIEGLISLLEKLTVFYHSKENLIYVLQ